MHFLLFFSVFFLFPGTQSHATSVVECIAASTGVVQKNIQNLEIQALKDELETTSDEETDRHIQLSKQKSFLIGDLVRSTMRTLQLHTDWSPEKKAAHWKTFTTSLQTHWKHWKMYEFRGINGEYIYSGNYSNNLVIDALGDVWKGVIESDLSGALVVDLEYDHSSGNLKKITYLPDENEIKSIIDPASFAESIRLAAYHLQTRTYPLTQKQKTEIWEQFSSTLKDKYPEWEQSKTQLSGNVIYQGTGHKVVIDKNADVWIQSSGQTDLERASRNPKGTLHFTLAPLVARETNKPLSPLETFAIDKYIRLNDARADVIGYIKCRITGRNLTVETMEFNKDVVKNSVYLKVFQEITNKFHAETVEITALQGKNLQIFLKHLNRELLNDRLQGSLAEMFSSRSETSKKNRMQYALEKTPVYLALSLLGFRADRTTIDFQHPDKPVVKINFSNPSGIL